ncbi:hypothetical protein [Terribacillus sp. DMT04]|uniref:hypothetical protein n=1 Tax=Terribacillus sp. DMT04 TaxID=2850441 RepID=UPI001C2BF8E3|nr:hypothetical protein [Terribacillus sp. DMT04]QXE03523.1 hypothetical protein KS242_17740 [Terribacillus sp. DMT04]
MTTNTAGTKKEALLLTENKLRQSFINDEHFNKQFNIMYQYYLEKVKAITDPEKHREYEDPFFEAVKSQYFNGYFIVRELLSDEQTTLDPIWLSNPEGILTEEIPLLIREAVLQNEEEALISETMYQFIMSLISEYEDVHYPLNQIAFDIAFLGSKRAFIDERDSIGVEAQKGGLESRMARIGDFTFITPQIFLGPKHVTAETEMWDLYWWSSLRKIDNKAGDVTLIQVNNGEGDNYIFNVNLASTFTPYEIQLIYNNLVSRFLEKNQLERRQLQVNVAIVKEYLAVVEEGAGQ